MKLTLIAITLLILLIGCCCVSGSNTIFYDDDFEKTSSHCWQYLGFYYLLELY